MYSACPYAALLRLPAAPRLHHRLGWAQRQARKALATGIVEGCVVCSEVCVRAVRCAVVQ